MDTRVILLFQAMLLGCARTGEDVAQSRVHLTPADATAATPEVRNPDDGPTRMCGAGELPEQASCVDGRRITGPWRALAPQVEGCYRPGEPTGDGRVKVTFDPKTGAVSNTAEFPPFAGTREGACIANVYRTIRIPPFSGAAYTLGLTFVVRGVAGWDGSAGASAPEPDGGQGNAVLAPPASDHPG